MGALPFGGVCAAPLATEMEGLAPSLLAFVAATDRGRKAGFWPTFPRLRGFGNPTKHGRKLVPRKRKT